MSTDQENQRIVELFSTPNPFEAESVAGELRAEGINCQVEGGPAAGVFSGLTYLDGVSLIKVVVLESDYERAHRIAAQWLEGEGASN